MTDQRESNRTNAILRVMRDVLRDTWRIFHVLARIMVPMALIARLLQEAGAIGALSGLLEPVMAPMRLPGQMGLVWATAIVVNLYGGLAVFAQVAPGLTLSAADVTVLTTVLLVAHALPVEARIAQRAGIRLWPTLLLRMAGAVVLGVAMAQIFHAGGWLQEPVRALWQPAPEAQGWAGWTAGQARSLALMFVIMLGLVLFLRVTERIGLMEAVRRLLSPFLRRLGLGPAAAPITVIGMTMGISYGGGMIIEESRTGHMTGRETFHAMNLLNLSHSLFEDSLLMMAVGGHVIGVFGARFAFTLLVVPLLVRATRGLSDERFARLFLCRAG